MEITLKDTLLDDLRDKAGPNPKRWYHGSGRATMALNSAHEPLALVYDDAEPGWPNHDRDELRQIAGPGGAILEGMCSCWEFCVD